MKKIIVLVLVIFFIFMSQKKEPQIKVRVIPNSNEKSDLVVKEKVKNSLIEYLNTLEFNNDYEKDKAIIEDNLDEIRNQLLKIDDVTVSFEYHNMGEKAYDGKVIKPEESLTLLVIIGKGSGDNWWGTLYPNYLEKGSSEKVTYKFWIEEIFNGG